MYEEWESVLRDPALWFGNIRDLSVSTVDQIMTDIDAFCPILRGNEGSYAEYRGRMEAATLSTAIEVSRRDRAPGVMNPRYEICANAELPTPKALIDYSDRLASLEKYLRSEIAYAQAVQSEHADKHRSSPPVFSVGDHVWLNR
jgi:hypothetical protein